MKAKKAKLSIQSRRITTAIRDFVRCAIANGEMGYADRKYLLEVLAPGVADVKARTRQFNRRRVLAARRAPQATY